MLHAIDSATPFDVVFIDFWRPGVIPDRDGYQNILTCLYCMTCFGLRVSSGLKEIASDYFAR